MRKAESKDSSLCSIILCLIPTRKQSSETPVKSKIMINFSMHNLNYPSTSKKRAGVCFKRVLKNSQSLTHTIKTKILYQRFKVTEKIEISTIYSESQHCRHSLNNSSGQRALGKHSFHTSMQRKAQHANSWWSQSVFSFILVSTRYYQYLPSF